MKLERNDKSICIHACINKYGDEGKVILDNYDLKTRDDWDIKEQEGMTVIYNHPIYGKILLVVFEGTRSNKDEGRDWGYNFDTKKIKKFINNDKELVVPYGNENSKIKMHRGLVRLYSYIRNDVRERIKDAIEKGIPIWITGHSLGGGETTCCFIDVHYMMNDEMNMSEKDISHFLTGYGAASLRVGNSHFAKSFNKRANGNFYNEWFGNDTVHEVPRIWQGYRHVKKTKRWSDWKANLQIPFVNLFKIATLGLLPSIAIQDHYPQKLSASIEGKPVPPFWKIIAEKKELKKNKK